MTKRLVDIDDAVLEIAQQTMGTSTIKETVNVALQSAVREAQRTQLDMESLQRFSAASTDLTDPTVMAKAWELAQQSG